MVGGEALLQPVGRDHARRRGEPGVVDQQVDPVGARGDVGSDARGFGHHRQVTAHEFDLRVRGRGLDLLERGGGPGRIAAVADHPPAVARQFACDDLSDARAGTGDDRGLQAAMLRAAI